MKSLYGLKQAPQVWHETVKTVIMKLGFKRSDAEPCLFFKNHGANLAMIALYVYDMLVMAATKQEVEAIQMELTKRFDMKDLGTPERFLGMNICVSEKGIRLSLEGYIDKMLANTKGGILHGTKVSASPKLDLSKVSDDSPRCDESEYRSLVGKSIYAANTARPDISYITLYLSMFLIEPREEHMKAAYRVLRYLKETKYFGLYYRVSEKDVIGYSDAEFAPGKLKPMVGRKSRSGFIFKYSESPVSWLSKKQSQIASSTVVSEMYALYSAVCEGVWIQKLFKELQIKQMNPTLIIWCDNKGTIANVTNKGFHEGTKHIDVKYNYINEEITKGSVRVSYINTSVTIADMFTKALPRVTLEKLIEYSGMNSGMRGSVGI